jgi:hypothetical protein
MYTSIDGNNWTLLEPGSAREIVAVVNGHLSTLGDSGSREPLIYPAPQHPTPDTGLGVTSVWRRALDFYPDGWALYRFACLVEDIPELAGYESPAFAFAIIGPIGQPNHCVLLDWTSTPLSRLNRQLGLDLAPLEPRAVRQYLIFFCTFLGGNPDARDVTAPFLLPQDSSWFDWDDALEDLEVVAQRSGLQRFMSTTETNRADVFDLPELREADAASEEIGTVAATRASPADSNQVKRQAVDAALRVHAGTPKRIADDASDNPVVATNPETPEARLDTEHHIESVDPSSLIEDRWHMKYEALVWYGDTLFWALFEVVGDGTVSMIRDKPIPGAVALPVPRWEVQRVQRGIRLLCRQMKREIVSASELLRRADTPIEPQSVLPVRSAYNVNRLRGLRVRDGLESARTFKRPIKLHDVEFTHDVILDDAVFESSLEMLGCRFLRRLSACDATVKGALRLNGSRIDGAISLLSKVWDSTDDLARRRPRPVVDLSGLKAERGLFADRVTAFGSVKAERIRVGGALQARGLQVYHRPGVPEGDSSLNLSYSQIDGPLDLSGYVARQREPGGRQRTILGAPATLVGIRADECDLRGVWVKGVVDLASCDIRGPLKLGVVGVGGNEEFWRSRIEGFLNFARGKMRVIELSGCEVLGDLSFVELQLTGSLFGRLAGRFRTRIAGDVVGSGAKVSGDIDLMGAWIGGQIVFTTGSIGRLNADVDAWAEPQAGSPSALPRLCPTEASAILLQDLSVDASMHLIGIRLRGGQDVLGDGGVTAHGVRVGGGLRFWRGGMSADLLRRKMRQLSQQGLQISEVGMETTVAAVRADITGGLDLRGIRVGSTIDLSRARISGEVRMNNARIDGNLRVHSEGDTASCTADHFNADNARIGGDADLRGLEVVNGDLEAHDIEVAGQLVLATPHTEIRALTAGNAHAVVARGRLDLEGTKAARLVLSSANVGQNVPENHPKAAITLARCRLGQLTITGFESTPPTYRRRSDTRFPRVINLQAIDVGDWEVHPETESLPLLRATLPRWFDGRNFVDVEQRLAKIGKKRKANQIYQQMTKQGASSRWARFWNFWNFIFSGNGTHPEWMFGWLLLTLVPVVAMLANPANVEFTVGNEDGGKDVRPMSDGRRLDLDRDWGWIKATGLAASYALPVRSGAGGDPVRARLAGRTCVDIPPLPSLVVAQQGAAPSSGSKGCKRLFALDISPHGCAMILSGVQFLLWIFVAANLPAIARRRS